MVQQDRPQMTIWRMRIACSMTESADTHSEYVTLIVFYCKYGCKNAPQYYVIRTISFVFNDKVDGPTPRGYLQMCRLKG